MVRIRLWLLGIISAMLGLRMLQLLCRLPIKLHSYYMRINVRFELPAIAFEHILIRHNIIIAHSERALFDLNARVEAQGGIVHEAVGQGHYSPRDDTRAFKSNRARSLFCVIIIILTDVTRIHMSHPNPKYII